MLTGKCVTLAEVGTEWHRENVTVPLLLLSLCALPLSFLHSHHSAHMKPGHAPSGQQNRQLPPVGLEGHDLKTQKQPQSVPLFSHSRWSNNNCSKREEGAEVMKPKDRQILSPQVRKHGERAGYWSMGLLEDPLSFISKTCILILKFCFYAHTPTDTFYQTELPDISSCSQLTYN